MTIPINITFQKNESYNWGWYMNNSTFRANYELVFPCALQDPILNNSSLPLLNLAYEGNTSYPYDPQWNVYNVGKNYSVRVVLYNQSPAVHPMHLHGHNFYVVAEGVGTWDGSVNSGNVQRRDVQLLQPSNSSGPGYLVVEYITDNPGVWPLHCHIAWHVGQGLYVNMMVSSSHG